MLAQSSKAEHFKKTKQTLRGNRKLSANLPLSKVFAYKTEQRDGKKKKNKERTHGGRGGCVAYFV